MVTLSPRRVDTPRGPIEVAEVGGPADGPVVLVVHGLPGDWRQGRTVAEDLAREARVLLVSRPGYGRTPLRSGRTPAEQAALFTALLDTLGVDRAVVLGISGGGPSAFAFAAGHPERCQGLLLCCALAPHLMTPPPVMRALAAVPGVWRAAAAAVRLRARLRTAEHISMPNASDLTPLERARALEPPVAADLRRFAAEQPLTMRGSGLRNDTRCLGGMAAGWPGTAAVPTVVLHGDADAVVPPSHAEWFAKTIPGARLEIVAGLGHAVPLFARDRVAATLRGLLTG